MKDEKLKIKKAIEKGNKDGAQIFAQNAIRKKHEAINYLKLSSKMDAVASRLDAANRTQQLTQDIYRAVPNLQRALGQMNVEQVSTNMDAFEKLFQDLDVRGEYVSNAIDSTTASATPADQVDSLISQVAEEYALDVSGVLNDAKVPQKLPETRVQEGSKAKVDPLQERLNNLKS